MIDKILAFVFVIIPLMAWNGMLAMFGLNWFIAPYLGLPLIGFFPAVAIGVVITWFVKHPLWPFPHSDVDIDYVDGQIKIDNYEGSAMQWLVNDVKRDFSFLIIMLILRFVIGV